MPRTMPPHLYHERTRHGKVIFYVRKAKGPRIRIRGEFGSDHFAASYRAAIFGDPIPPMAEGDSIKSRIETSPKKSGHIYFASAGSYIKIGFATNVKKRIAGLQTGHHKKLSILRVERGTPEDEAKFHKRFGKLRTRGEWFRREGDLAEYLGIAPNPSRDNEWDMAFKEIRL